MIRRAYVRARAAAAVLLLLALALLAALAMGTALDNAAAAGAERTTVTAYNDGFIDGQSDLTGDDNRDGRIDEDESGWDCTTMGNRQCGPTVVTVSAACTAEPGPALRTADHR